MGLNPTGSEIPRSLTEIGTTIDAALDSKADFVRIATAPLNVTVPSQYTITGEMFYDSGELSAPFFLDNDAENSWSSGSDFLVIDSGFWRLTLSQATWLSVESSSTLPQNCTWSAGDLTSGTPSLFFTPELPKQTGQFALVNNSVMWQNLGTDASPSWVALVKSGDLANYATIAAVNLKANIASPALTGNPTAPTQTAGNDSTRIATTAFVAASFATTSAVAAGYVPRITSVDNRLTRFDGTTGAVQSSGVTVDDNNRFTGIDRINENVSFGNIVFIGGGAIRAANGASINLGNSRATSNDNFLNLFLRNTATVSFGPNTCLSEQSNGVAQIGTTDNNALGSLALTNLTASGTLRVGGGTVVANILSATATLDFPSIGSNGTETLTITVTGAVAGDSVFLGCPAGLDAGLVFCASVTAANTVTVRMHNSSGGSVDPASGTFRATVIRF
jgi:hypothetical protein